MSALLPFVEAFTTVQGEGPATGRLATFIRFGGCNLSCSWCDSAYTWDASRVDLREEIELMTAARVFETAGPIAPLVVITGGEPLLNQRRPEFVRLLKMLRTAGAEIHVETNGTIVPNSNMVQLIDLFVVSPKLPHAGEHKPKQSAAMPAGWGLLLDFGPIVAHAKIVVREPADVQRALDLAYGAGFTRERIWLMPEGTTIEQLASRWQWVAEAAVEHGVNASHRLHVLAWGDERGK